MDFDLFLMICNYIGTIAFAASGAIKGFGKRLDIFGISLLAIVTAVGGGILRDSIISRFPLRSRRSWTDLCLYPCSCYYVCLCDIKTSQC